MKRLLQHIILLILITVLLCAFAVPTYAAKADFSRMPRPTLIPAVTAPPTLIPAWTAQPTLIPAWTAPPTNDDWMKQEQERGFTTAPTPTPTPTPTPVSTPIFGRKPIPTATPTPFDFSSALKPLPSPAATPVPTQSTSAVTPAATPVPTQSTSAATPKPTAVASAMVITKHPTGEVVDSGGSASFVARADNYSWCAWRFISPDDSTEVIFDVSASQFPGLKVEGGNKQTLKLSNIPAEMNGWKAMCLFADANGKWIYTDGALITVKNAAAAVTPSPTAAPATPAPTPTAAPVPTEAIEAEPTAIPAGAVEIPIMTPAPSPTAEPEKTDKGGGSLVTALLAVIALLLIGGVAAFVLYSRKMKAAEKRRMARRFRCNNCGWSPKSLNDIPNFCPKCGDEFNEHDFRR